jgi:hypothetical protein
VAEKVVLTATWMQLAFGTAIAVRRKAACGAFTREQKRKGKPG